LGKTNQIIKNYDVAISHFNKALELSNLDPKIYFQIALFYEETNQLNKVVDLYYDAVKNHPDNYEIRQTLGIALCSMDYYSQAENEFFAAIEIDFENPEAYYNLGLVYERQNKYEDAKSNYEKALDFDSNHQNAKNNLDILLKNEKEKDWQEKRNNQEV
ncbi:MAG: tetratricopeptide repeat protein, partial [Candidatus Aenigmarchaeota archaeon]|nr:tetratricopeptide repeat protein [Candidatus Aenigmarchaeota archaeon]